MDFEALFEDHFDAIYGYLARRVGPDIARDLAAETFTRAYAARKRFDPERGEPRAWLFGIARKLLLKGASKARTKDALVERLATELRVAEPFNYSVEDEPSGALRAALESLSMREREIVLMASWEGLTPREIGAVVGLPANVIRVRLHRARKRLKRSLFESGDAAADFLAGPGAPPAA